MGLILLVLAIIGITYALLSKHDDPALLNWSFGYVLGYTVLAAFTS